MKIIAPKFTNSANVDSYLMRLRSSLVCRAARDKLRYMNECVSSISNKFTNLTPKQVQTITTQTSVIDTLYTKINLLNSISIQLRYNMPKAFDESTPMIKSVLKVLRARLQGLRHSNSQLANKCADPTQKTLIEGVINKLRGSIFKGNQTSVTTAIFTYGEHEAHPYLFWYLTVNGYTDVSGVLHPTIVLAFCMWEDSKWLATLAREAQAPLRYISPESETFSDVPSGVRLTKKLLASHSLLSPDTAIPVSDAKISKLSLRTVAKYIQSVVVNKYSIHLNLSPLINKSKISTVVPEIVSEVGKLLSDISTTTKYTTKWMGAYYRLVIHLVNPQDTPPSERKITEMQSLQLKQLGFSEDDIVALQDHRTKR